MTTKYGEGSVFQRGDRWHIRYSFNGRRISETAGPRSTKESAEALLARRLREVYNDREGLKKHTGRKGERTTVSDLLALVKKDHAMRRLKSERPTGYHADAVDRRIGNYRAAAVTPELLAGYIAGRRRDEVADATIDRELEILRRGFALGKQAGLVPFPIEVPRLVKLHANARRGFLEADQLRRVIAGLGDPDFADFIEWLAWTGQRPGEAGSLEWSGYDRVGRSLRLAPENAKTGRGRVIPLKTPQLLAILKRRESARIPACRLIFHRDGKSLMRKAGTGNGFVKPLYQAWARAVADVDPTLIPYDLRRTALRNLRLTGTGETVAMTISGHTSRSTFDRYTIVDTSDMADAFDRVGALVGNLTPSQIGHKTKKRKTA